MYVEFVKGEGESMPFEDDTFDVIVNCRVLWTLTQPEVSLKEWKRGHKGNLYKIS